MTPSTCFLCAAIAITERRPVPQRAMNAAGSHKLAPGDSSAYQGFRRRYLRLLGDDGKFAPVPRWTRNEVRRDHRGVLQDQFYAKTLDVRQSRRATLNVLQARSFLCYSPLLSKHHQTRALSPPRLALLGAVRVIVGQNEDQLDRMGGPLDA